MEAQALVIGRGLAGAEAAWQAAGHGLQVKLAEMRPHTQTADRHTDRRVGQLTRQEGCQGSVAAVSWACRNAARVERGALVLELLAETIHGAPLRHVISADRCSSQPMQSIPGLLPWLCPRAPTAHKVRVMPLFYGAKLVLGAPPGGLGRPACA